MEAWEKSKFFEMSRIHLFGRNINAQCCNNKSSTFTTPPRIPNKEAKNKTFPFETDFKILVSIFSLGQQQHLVVHQLILTNDVIEL